MKAWHFTYGWQVDDGTPLVVGKTYVYDGEPKLRQGGYHASVRLIDALDYSIYFFGNVVSRVELGGKMHIGKDEVCAQRRTVLWAIEADEVLHRFALRCAEEAIAHVGYADERVSAALDAKRKWLKGELSDVDLDVAMEAVEAISKELHQKIIEMISKMRPEWEELHRAWCAVTSAMWAASDCGCWAAHFAAQWACWAHEGGPEWAALEAAARQRLNRYLTAMVCAAHRKKEEEDAQKETDKERREPDADLPERCEESTVDESAEDTAWAV